MIFAPIFEVFIFVDDFCERIPQLITIYVLKDNVILLRSCLKYIKESSLKKYVNESQATLQVICMKYV